MNKAIQQSENPRYMTQHLKAQLEIKEEREVQEEMDKIQIEYQPDWKNIKHKYMKGTDISHIRNYRAMISRITQNKNANQRQIRTEHCKRPRCRDTAAETFAGYVQSPFGGLRNGQQQRRSGETKHFQSALMPVLNIGQELRNTSIGISTIDGGDSVNAQGATL